MQAGFTLVETDSRSKNAGNIIMKNLMTFALVALPLGWVTL
jgi:ammonia channel protein AmtB